MTATAARPSIGSTPRTATGTMRAATLAEPGTVVVTQSPIPQPGPRQVRVRLEGCGVCASNLPPFEGRSWFNYPMGPGALGHEGWGVVDAAGSAVHELVEGDRVAFLSGSAYAEYDVADVDQCVKLPPELAGVPLPGEPLGCAVNIFRRSDVKPGQTVAIIGIGFLGALLVQLCKHAGARVIAISRRPYSLDIARKCGADETIELTADKWQVINRVAELTGGVGGYGEMKGWCERVIECTGKQEGLDLVGEITAVRGTVIIAGFHQDGPRSIDLQLWNWRGLDVVNAHERDPRMYLAGIREAATLVQRGVLDPSALYTHEYPLDQLGAALQTTHDRPEGFVKALVRMEATSA